MMERSVLSRQHAEDERLELAGIQQLHEHGHRSGRVAISCLDHPHLSIGDAKESSEAGLGMAAALADGREGGGRHLPDIMAGVDVVVIAIDTGEFEECFDVALDQGNLVVISGVVLDENRVNASFPGCGKAVMAVQHDAVRFAVDLENRRNGNFKILMGDLFGDNLVVDMTLAADGLHLGSPAYDNLIPAQCSYVNTENAGCGNNSTRRELSEDLKQARHRVDGLEAELGRGRQ